MNYTKWAIAMLLAALFSTTPEPGPRDEDDDDEEELRRGDW